MSVFKKLLFGAGGAALLASGLASGAQAHTVAGSTAGSCDLYAQQYAGAYAPQFGAAGWDDAYRFAYNRCVAGGPGFVVTPVAAAPYGSNYGYNYGIGGALAAPVYAGANIAGSAIQAGATVAGSAIHAGTSLAGAALSIPGTVLGGLFAPPATSSAALAPAPAAAVEPVVRKNYRGTFEQPQVVVADETLTSTAALAAPAMAPAANTPEWYEYCAAKYRSFNPETGMYLAYSGQYRMCN